MPLNCDAIKLLSGATKFKLNWNHKLKLKIIHILCIFLYIDRHTHSHKYILTINNLGINKIAYYLYQNFVCPRQEKKTLHGKSMMGRGGEGGPIFSAGLFRGPLAKLWKGPLDPPPPLKGGLGTFKKHLFLQLNNFIRNFYLHKKSNLKKVYSEYS